MLQRLKTKEGSTDHPHNPAQACRVKHEVCKPPLAWAASSPRVQEKASPHTVRICAGVLPVSRGDRTPRSDDNPENPDRGDKWNSSAWSLVVARPAIASACAIACSVVVLPALARLVISTWALGLVGASF